MGERVGELQRLSSHMHGLARSLTGESRQSVMKVAKAADEALIELSSSRVDRNPLGSCEACHFHQTGVGKRCGVRFYGEQCEGFIRECCCGGSPVDSWRNDPAPRWLEDDEQFCSECFAGTESSEHREKCGGDNS